MEYGIIQLSVVPLRAEPSHKSELTSQLLFGEMFTILETRNDWLRIQVQHDQYEAWISKYQQQVLAAYEFNELSKSSSYLSFDLVQLLLNNQSIYSVVLGSTLPWFRAGSCRIGNHHYSFEGNARLPEINHSSKTIIENAYMYLNAPYLWGGRSPFGIDCSGFTQMVFKLSGLKLKRDAWMQAEQGQTVHLIDEAQPGDIAFFDNDEGKIIHAGILVNKSKIIHASGQVRVDSIDHQGIYNAETKRYTHNLRLIRRII